MSERRQKQDFRPTRDEIKAMGHYWQAAVQNVKAAKNREERRKAAQDVKKRKGQIRKDDKL